MGHLMAIYGYVGTGNWYGFNVGLITMSVIVVAIAWWTRGDQ